MLSPVHDTRKEITALHQIALFNPRFRARYAPVSTVSILILAVVLLVLGVRWLNPFNPNYTNYERHEVWFGIAVMPFAGVLGSNLIVEFLLKGVQVATWALFRVLTTTWPTKIIGLLAIVFLALGAILAALGGDCDQWGYLCLLLALFIGYWFVWHAWRETDFALTGIEPTDSVRPWWC